MALLLLKMVTKFEVVGSRSSDIVVVVAIAAVSECLRGLYVRMRGDFW